MAQADRQANPGIGTVIVGLGATGLSCARFLAARGEPFAVTDSRPAPPARAEFERAHSQAPLALGGFDAGLLAGARTVIMSPGVGLTDPALAPLLPAGAEIIGDIELFARHADAPVVAITGSNGKSTVTTLVGAMFDAADRVARVGGNLGTPALDLLGGPPPAAYVLELSSFQLETTRSLDAACATVLNVSPDHMDRYADLAGYAAAKARVYAGTGVAVLNDEDPLVRGMRIPGRPSVTFGVGPGFDYGIARAGGADWLACRGAPLVAVAELAIRGRHNLANALAALALGEAAGLPRAAMARALRAFTGLPHRCQHVRSRGGIDWIDDSKGTNVGATCAAIDGLDTHGRIVLIAGGQGKGQSFDALAPRARARLRAAVLIGADADRIEAAIGAVTAVQRAADMHAAVARAAALAVPGDCVLLSPACASFDMYADYAARGDAFARAVRELPA